jgi:hypothetical protein
MAAKYLTDIPDGRDLFLNSPHEDVAEKISEYIKSDLTPTHMIGLDGSWGSGKSNIIKILKNKLNVADDTGNHNTNKYNFFLYDAWEHQEDFQKRSFIEELTEYLLAEKILPEEYKPGLSEILEGNIPTTWKEKYRRLLSKARETTIAVIPHLSPGLMASLLLLFFTPIITSILKLYPKWKVCSIIPVLLYFLYVLLKFNKYCKRYRSTNGTVIPYKALLKGFLPDFINFYDKEYTKKVVNELVWEDEPSVKSFKNWMVSVSSNLVKDKKLVIVFDNMDRLPREKVLSFWSIIHTFNCENKHDYKNVWVIVPYDYLHVQKSFFSSEQQDADDRATQFLNKTFSISFRVPPPVLTTWHSLFDIKYKEMFGADELDQLEEVRNVYGLYEKDITPRRIILFLNELLSNRLSHSTKVELKYFALFVLRKDEILYSKGDNRTTPVLADRIYSRTYVNSFDPIFVNDMNLTKNIASIVYNINPNSANQVLLSKEIPDICLKEDVERAIIYVKCDEFIKVFIYSLNQNKGLVSYFITLLDRLMNESVLNQLQVEDIESNNLWRVLNSISKVHRTNSPIISTADKVLLRRTSDAERQDDAIRLIGVLDEFMQTTLPSEYDEDIKTAYELTVLDRTTRPLMYVKCIQEISLCVRDIQGFDLFEFLGVYEVDPASLILILDYPKVPFNPENHFKLSCNKDALNKYIFEMIPSKPTEYSNDTIDKLTQLGYSFDILQKDIESLYDLEDDMDFKVSMYFGVIRHFKKDIYLKKLKPETIDYQAKSELRESRLDIFLELFAMRIAYGPAYNYNTPSFNEIDESQSELVKRVCDKLIDYIGYDDLLLNYLGTYPQKITSLYTVIIKSINEDPHKQIQINNVAIVIKSLSLIVQKTGLSLPSFLNKLDTVFVKSTGYTFDPSSLPDIDLFQEISNNDYKVGKILINEFLKNIDTLEQLVWEHEFHSPVYYVPITKILIESNKLQYIPQKAEFAYNSLLTEIETGSIPTSKLKDVKEFFDSSHKITYSGIIKRIIDNYATRDISKSDFINLYEHFNIVESLEDIPHYLLHILTPWSNDIDCVKLMARNKDAIEKVVDKNQNDALTFVNNIIEIAQNSNDDEIKGLADVCVPYRSINE